MTGKKYYNVYYPISKNIEFLGFDVKIYDFKMGSSDCCSNCPTLRCVLNEKAWPSLEIGWKYPNSLKIKIRCRASL